MKKHLLVLCAICALCLTAAAQKASKPTLTGVEPTAAQVKAIQQGIELHDAQKYDEAIKIYQSVLDENPDCTNAMYEMALSYRAKGDVTKAIEIASKGIKYKSPVLARFYILIGNTWDEQGNPQKAIELYQETIKILKDEKNSEAAMASVYYNLGVTYFGQKQYKESREAFKKSVEYNFSYGSPSYSLAEVFYATKYKVPALLAAARLISLELNSRRTARSVAIFLDILKPAEKDEKTGDINIFLDMNAPKDEGDFAIYDLLLNTLTMVKTDEDKDKTDEEIFAGAVETLIGILAEDKKLKSTFVGKNYVPFMAEMKRLGYAKTFAYLVLQQSGNKKAEKYLTDNSRQTLDFINWAKDYFPPK